MAGSSPVMTMKYTVMRGPDPRICNLLAAEMPGSRAPPGPGMTLNQTSSCADLIRASANAAKWGEYCVSLLQVAKQAH
jgi:hypothetical protein